jgi:hypothetical protein
LDETGPLRTEKKADREESRQRRKQTEKKADWLDGEDHA